MRYSLRSLLACTVVLSICFGLMAWDFAGGLMLSVILVSGITSVLGYRAKRRGFAVAGLVVAGATLVLFIPPAFSHYYASGRYYLTVGLKDLPPNVEQVAYMAFFERPLADFVIDNGPEFDDQFTVVTPSPSSSFDAEIRFSKRFRMLTDTCDRHTQERFLVILLEMSDGTQKRSVVSVPNLQNTNPNQRSIVVDLDSAPDEDG